jgi:hypothetical protein
VYAELPEPVAVCSPPPPPALTNLSPPTASTKPAAREVG